MTPNHTSAVTVGSLRRHSYESPLGAKPISIGYFDGNQLSQRIVEKLGFQKLGVAHNATIRCLDGTKLDRHEYILTSPDALPELDISWG